MVTPSSHRRLRQTRFPIENGAAVPDPESSLALLPGKVIGQWLHKNESIVRGRLLDVGCGNRPYAGWYDPLADEVVAVDVVDASATVLAHADRLPLGDKTVDTVLMTEVLEHVPNAEVAMAEMARVLRPDGHLLITVPFLYPTHEAPYDFHRFTHYGLRSLLERHGFEVVHLDAKGGIGLLAAHHATLALRLLMMSFGGHDDDQGLMRHRWARAVVTRPQQMLLRHVHSRPGVRGLAGYTSLGYMATARRL